MMNLATITFPHEDGRCHLRSRSLNATSLPVLSKVHHEVVMKDVALPDGRRGRVIAKLTRVHEVQNANTPHVVHFALAISRESLDRILAMQRWCAMGVAAFLIAASILIALTLTKRSFRKVDDFSKHLREIDFDTLGNRLPEEGLPVELAPLAARFNQALERLDHGARRELRFNANVAHELRTPVAELRAIADVGLQECQDGTLENPATYFEDASELAQRMSSLVDVISSLNRSDLGREAVEKETTDLITILQRSWKTQEDKAASRGLKVSVDLPEQWLCETDPSLLQATFINLMSNAVSHCPAEGEISLSADPSTQTIVLSNTNANLQASDLEHLIEPFWQKDASRSERTHFGIGMALVDAYTRLLGIEYALDLPTPDVYAVTLRLP